MNRSKEREPKTYSNDSNRSMPLASSNGTISLILQDFARRIRFSRYLSDISQLDEYLTSKDQIFKAPPLTPDLVKAIRLISPHCDFPPMDKYRQLWEADQNGACWGEYESLQLLYKGMRVPSKVLEIGPGMGRSLVFFYRKLGWLSTEFHAFEGEGTSTKYTNQGPRFEDSYCGNFAALSSVLKYNGLDDVSIFDAKEVKLSQLPGPYDYLCSFYGVGFHWSLEHFWDDIMTLLHERSIGVFTISEDYKPFARLNCVNSKTIELKTVWPKNGRLKLLVLSKSPLPIL